MPRYSYSDGARRTCTDDAAGSSTRTTSRVRAPAKVLLSMTEADADGVPPRSATIGDVNTARPRHARLCRQGKVVRACLLAFPAFSLRLASSLPILYCRGERLASQIRRPLRQSPPMDNRRRRFWPRNYIRESHPTCIPLPVPRFRVGCNAARLFAPPLFQRAFICLYIHILLAFRAPSPPWLHFRAAVRPSRAAFIWLLASGVWWSGARARRLPNQLRKL